MRPKWAIDGQCGSAKAISFDACANKRHGSESWMPIQDLAFPNNVAFFCIMMGLGCSGYYRKPRRRAQSNFNSLSRDWCHDRIRGHLINQFRYRRIMCSSTRIEPRAAVLSSHVCRWEFYSCRTILVMHRVVSICPSSSIATLRTTWVDRHIDHALFRVPLSKQRYINLEPILRNIPTLRCHGRGWVLDGLRKNHVYGRFPPTLLTFIFRVGVNLSPHFAHPVELSTSLSFLV